MEERLGAICKKVFRKPDFAFDPNHSPATVKGWDSFSFVQLVVGIEKEFAIKLPLAQVTKVKNLGELLSLVQAASTGGNR